MNFLILAESISWSERLNYIGTGTLLGLGVVFAVLILLWVILEIFHFCFSKATGTEKGKTLKPEVPASAQQSAEASDAIIAADECGDECELAAAITAAVAVYTDLPQTGFRVVSFKKVERTAHWNEH